MRLSRYRSGGRKVGCTKKIRAVGFNGTAVITWDEDQSTMNDRSDAGARCAGMLRKSGKTVPRARSIAGLSKGKRYFTGPTIHASSNFE
jgi:hypothetical protein